MPIEILSPIIRILSVYRAGMVLFMGMEKRKKRILFVCWGNICRSPMAEYIMKHLADQAGLSAELEIDSAAVSSEETGNPVYPPARRILKAHGVFCGDHRARRMQAADYDRYDYLIGMDAVNIERMKRIAGGDPQGKIRTMMSFCGRNAEVSDPWYTGDFAAAYNDILAGCNGLLEQLLEEGDR